MKIPMNASRARAAELAISAARVFSMRSLARSTARWQSSIAFDVRLVALRTVRFPGLVGYFDLDLSQRERCRP